MKKELVHQDDLNKMKIERIKRTEAAKGALLTYCRDTVRIPNGNIREWDYIAHQGAAAILPVTAEGKPLLVRQYRNALDRFTIEIPAGGLEGPEEPTMEAATRELTEETGFKAGAVEFLCSIFPTVAYSGEKIDIYIAWDLSKASRHLDEDEYINVEEWDMESLEEMIYNGTLQDGKTVAALMAYKNACLIKRFPGLPSCL